MDTEQGKMNLHAIDYEEFHWLEGNGECTNYKDQEMSYADCVANHQGYSCCTNIWQRKIFRYLTIHIILY